MAHCLRRSACMGHVERNTHEWGMAFSFLMIVLTFPSGYLLLLYALAPIDRFLMAHGIMILNLPQFTLILIEWPVYVVVGYLQWFALTSWLARKLERWFKQPEQQKH